MKSKLTMSVLLISLVLIVHPLSLHQQAATPSVSQFTPTTSPGICTAFCLDNGDHCVFGANQDNSLEANNVPALLNMLVSTRKSSTYNPNICL